MYFGSALSVHRLIPHLLYDNLWISRIARTAPAPRFAPPSAPRRAGRSITTVSSHEDCEKCRCFRLHASHLGRDLSRSSEQVNEFFNKYRWPLRESVARSTLVGSLFFCQRNRIFGRHDMRPVLVSIHLRQLGPEKQYLCRIVCPYKQYNKRAG